MSIRGAHPLLRRCLCALRRVWWFNSSAQRARAADGGSAICLRPQVPKLLGRVTSSGALCALGWPIQVVSTPHSDESSANLRAWCGDSRTCPVLAFVLRYTDLPALTVQSNSPGSSFALLRAWIDPLEDSVI